MAPFDKNDDSVVVIIGTGAGGGVLANELAQKGVKVVALEAGGRYLPEDYLNDEWASFGQLAWLDARTTSGDWRVHKDFAGLPAWIVKAVGGTTTHWAGASLRFQEHEWKALTSYGAVAGANLHDWPIDGAELAPWYDKAEEKLGVTRTGNRPGLPGNNNYKVFEKGAKALGYKEVHTGRMAIQSSEETGNRISCQQTGFCFQGCKWGAKWSAAYTDIPEGEATGNLEVRDRSHVARILHNEAGKVTGVEYFDKDGALQMQKARIVCVAGNSFESPRLLLNSASTMFPDGLGNSSGMVGRNYMRHTTGSVYAVFDKPVRMWRGTTMAGIMQDEARHDPSRGFVGGYELETLSLGLPFMAAFLNPGGWGRSFTTALDSYENMAGLWIVGEDMPQMGNGVTLSETKDQHGLPVANVNFDEHPNDVAMRNHAYKQGIAMYDAVGATRSFPTPPYPSTHNLGTNRMSEKPADGVVNKHGQSHDIANLFVSDGSQFTTGASENPTLTIVALAIRQADHIAREMSANNI